MLDPAVCRPALGQVEPRPDPGRVLGILAPPVEADGTERLLGLSGLIPSGRTLRRTNRLVDEDKVEFLAAKRFQIDLQPVHPSVSSLRTAAKLQHLLAVKLDPLGGRPLLEITLALVKQGEGVTCVRRPPDRDEDECGKKNG